MGGGLDFGSMTRYDKIVMSYKMLHGQCPEKLKNRFAYRSQVSNYQTRNSDKLQITRPRLELTKKSFCFSVERGWNACQELSEELVISLSLKST